MILLLGGTSETGDIATALAEHGYRVLVSMATDEPLDVGTHPGIRRRSGRLDEREILDVIKKEAVTAIVDAAHPYASALHQTAQLVADSAGIRCVRFCRPAAFIRAPHVREVADHEQAATTAFSFGRAVLLTTGSRVLTPYVTASRQSGLRLVARVLARSESLQACRDAGLPAEDVITGKGPFTPEQNRDHIRQFGVGVLVTKNSGEAGGVQAKLDAARLEGCQVIVIRRPETAPFDAVMDLATLLERVARDA